METYSRFFRNFEESFFAFTTISILAHSCLGAVAAMAVLMNGTGLNQMIQLFAVVASCMLFNGSVLSQQKPKVVFNLLLIGTIVNTLVATYNYMN